MPNETLGAGCGEWTAPGTKGPVSGACRSRQITLGVSVGTCGDTCSPEAPFGHCNGPHLDEDRRGALASHLVISRLLSASPFAGEQRMRELRKKRQDSELDVVGFRGTPSSPHGVLLRSSPVPIPGRRTPRRVPPSCQRGNRPTRGFVALPTEAVAPPCSHAAPRIAGAPAVRRAAPDRPRICEPCI